MNQTRKQSNHDSRTQRHAKRINHTHSKKQSRNKRTSKMITRRLVRNVVTHKCRGGSLTKKMLLDFSWLKTKFEQLNRYGKRAGNFLKKKLQGTHKDKSKRIQFYCSSEPSEFEQIVLNVKQKLLYPLVLKDNDSRTKLRRHIRNGTELRQLLHRLPKKNTKNTPHSTSKVRPESSIENEHEHECEDGKIICVTDGVQFDLKDENANDNQRVKDVLGFVESMMYVNEQSVQNLVKEVTLKAESQCTVTYNNTPHDVPRSEVMCTIKHVNSLISVISLDSISAKLSDDFKQSAVKHSHIFDTKYELQEWTPPILLGVGHVFSYSGRHIRMDMNFDWKNLLCHFYGITNYLIRFNKGIRTKVSKTALTENAHDRQSTPICIVVPPKGHNSILSIVNEVSLESTVINEDRLVLAQNQDISIAHCRTGQAVSVELFVNHGNDTINNLDSLWESLHRLLLQEDESLSFDYDAHAYIPTYSLYDAIGTLVYPNIKDEDDFNITFDIGPTKDAYDLLQDVSTKINRTIFVFYCEGNEELKCKKITPNPENNPIYLVVVKHNHKRLYHRLKCDDMYSPSKDVLVDSMPLTTTNPKEHLLNVLENIIKDNHMWCISFHNILLAYNFLSIEPRTAWWNKTSKDRYVKLEQHQTPPEITLQFEDNEMKNYLPFGKCKYLPFGYIEVVYHRDQNKENTNKNVVVVTTKASFYRPHVPNETEITNYNLVYETRSSAAKGIPFGRFKFSDFKSAAVQSYAKTGFAVNGDDGIYASIKLQDNAVVTLCSLGQFRIVTLHPGESRRFDMKYVVAFNENCQLQWMRKYKNNGVQRVSLGIDFLISNVQFTNVHPTLDTHVICQTTESPHWGYLKWRITQALTFGAVGGGLFAIGAVPMSLKFIHLTTGVALGS